MAVKKTKLFEAALRITSLADGFRRGGMAHPSREVVHAPGTFSQEQGQQILDEAQLVDDAGASVGKLVVRVLTEAEYAAYVAATAPADAAPTA